MENCVSQPRAACIPPDCHDGGILSGFHKENGIIANDKVVSTVLFFVLNVFIPFYLSNKFGEVKLKSRENKVYGCVFMCSK